MNDKIDMYKCVLCSKHYPLRDMDTTAEDVGIYICKMGMGCLEGHEYEIKDGPAPYPSLKVFKKKI